MKNLPQAQQGMVLVVGLIMLLLLTLMVSTVSTLSSTNLLGVGNQQWRSEALAASDVALEQVIPSLKPPLSGAYSAPVASSDIGVDINHDNVDDYLADVTPTCVRATLASASAPSSLSLAGMSNLTWNTVWDLDASVQDAVTGTSVRVRTGVRVLLSDAQKISACF
ncbi:MAG: hypothetical protein Q8R10_03905 [Pseudomonas sp.]|uniref:PilX N-terminal domain-containing pilus assembly protein n=1 Tax=Pseudomonas sp. TaxID=306 RepID=UPI00273442E9|nr:PilX N-terminal domain-containing pilus assembly protein [Pseudomonas sp.]MDP3845550.1 hypothetical protein [Pseudomonas sp.]